MALGNKFKGSLERYVDDFIMASANFDSHFILLDEIFHILQENNFTLKLKKSLFFQKEVNLSGFCLTTSGILPRKSGLKKFSEFSAIFLIQYIFTPCHYYR